jgi:putative transposase
LREFTTAPTSVTVSQDSVGRYFVSFLVEDALEVLPVVKALLGVDVGLKDMAVLSTGG